MEQEERDEREQDNDRDLTRDMEEVAKEDWMADSEYSYLHQFSE